MNITKHPLKNVFAVYLGTKKEIQEIALCQKEKDENGDIYYLDLLTDTIYSNASDNPNEVIGLEEHTLLGMLKDSTYRNEIVEKQYLTNKDLLDIYDVLNEDTNYKAFSKSDDSPFFIDYYNVDEDGIIFEEHEEALEQIILTQLASKKVVIITGDKGIGKSTLQDKLFIFEETNSEIDGISCWCIDYEEMLKNTTTNRHIQNRIDKTIQFLETSTEGTNISIDNVDFSNTYFITKIVEAAQKNGIFLMLISTNKLDKSKFDESVYRIIDLKELQEETKIKIFEKKLEELKEQFILNIPTDKLISILLKCDTANCMNTTNYLKNPKLGITIIENAMTIALVRRSDEVKIDYFVTALYQDNIKMHSETRKRTRLAFEDLENQFIIKPSSENQQSSQSKQLKKLFGILKKD